eukprot:59232_1
MADREDDGNEQNNQAQQPAAPNPYVDSNLVKAQQEFNPDKNKEFEKLHLVSPKNKYDEKDDEDDYKAPKKKQDTVFIKFKWDKSIKEKKDCDTKHMLFLIKLALDKVYARTTERNKYFESLGRKDRIMIHLDNTEVLTNLIKYCNALQDKGDKTYNQIDGNLLQNTRKKAFINDVITKLGGITMGWSTKIYAKLTKEVKIDADIGEVLIPNYEYTRLLCEGAIMADCSYDEMKKIVEDEVLGKLNNAKLNENKKKIMAFFEENKMDGLAFTTLEKKQFTGQLRDHINPDNKTKKK